MHHNLDIHPIPEKTLYINEITLINPVDYYETIQCVQQANHGENLPQDNIRVYVPLDLNKDLLLFELKGIYSSLGSPSEENESLFSHAVGKIISKLEIYDQVWTARSVEDAVRMKNGDAPDVIHSKQAIEIAREIIRILSQDEGTAECFPFDVIDDIKRDFGL